MLSAFDLRPLELRKLIAVRRAGNVNHFETALGAMPGLVVLWVIIGAVLPFPPA